MHKLHRGCILPCANCSQQSHYRSTLRRAAFAHLTAEITPPQRGAGQNTLSVKWGCGGSAHRNVYYIYIVRGGTQCGSSCLTLLPRNADRVDAEMLLGKSSLAIANCDVGRMCTATSWGIFNVLFFLHYFFKVLSPSIVLCKIDSKRCFCLYKLIEIVVKLCITSIYDFDTILFVVFTFSMSGSYGVGV